MPSRQDVAERRQKGVIMQENRSTPEPYVLSETGGGIPWNHPPPASLNGADGASAAPMASAQVRFGGTGFSAYRSWVSPSITAPDRRMSGFR
jgi:hypothetical protein